MAVVRIKLAGSGHGQDAYHAPLPTYQELLTNYSEGWVLANIPDADLHDDPKKIDPNGHQTSFGHQIVTLDDAGHAEWHAHLDKRYQEHKGEFRPHVI